MYLMLIEVVSVSVPESVGLVLMSSPDGQPGTWKCSPVSTKVIADLQVLPLARFRTWSPSIKQENSRALSFRGISHSPKKHGLENTRGQKKYTQPILSHEMSCYKA
jgi:hypothetical protein